MPDGFWARVAVLLFVGSIGTLFVPIAYEAVVYAAAPVGAFKVEVLIAVLNLALYIRQVWTERHFLAPGCQ